MVLHKDEIGNICLLLDIQRAKVLGLADHGQKVVPWASLDAEVRFATAEPGVAKGPCEGSLVASVMKEGVELVTSAC